ncbi:MAG: hypothetical protein U0353_17460 [Sandaracinus sp.]
MADEKKTEVRDDDAPAPARSEPRTDKDRDKDRDRDERDARKERVLHTRVPAVLEDELKRLATNLRMPVSNVVRAILEDAIEAVEVVGVRAEDELKGFVDRLAEQRNAIRQGATTAGRARKADDATSRVSDRDDKPSEATDKPSEAADKPSEAARNDSDEAATPSAEPRCPDNDASLDDVIGFQRLTLRSDSPCTVCGRVLPRGTEACRGVRDDGGPRVLVGPHCKLV